MINKFIVNACIFLLIALSSFATTVHAGQVNAFIYHRFDETRYPSTNIASDIFRQQLEYLSKNNIAVIGLEEIAKRLNSGLPLPEHAAALSVDDGYLSFYQVALPIIEEFGFSVSLFVNTDAVGQPGYMSWAQLADAEKRGVVIGNHTASHPYMVEMLTDESMEQWSLRIKADVEKAQQALGAHMARPVDLFVYPYGEYSPAIITLIKKLGFSAAFAQQSGVISESSDLYILPRFPMGGPFATFKGFVSKLNMQPLVVAEGASASPILSGMHNPPELVLNIPELPSVHAVNCFVQGDNVCSVEVAEDKGDNWYRVTAEKPLSGRRNKYTLTTRSSTGDWLWFSHLWIHADRTIGD